MTDRGARNASSTVQNVNSLRGACLAQGILATVLLRVGFPTIQVTESHPKALLWLLGIARPDRPSFGIGLSDLYSHICWTGGSSTVHERDAALGALAANAMVCNTAGWRDLFVEELSPYSPVPPVAYYMPMACR